MVVPSKFRGEARVAVERQMWEFLHDEISEGGLSILQKDGRFGPLREVFPEEANRWAEFFAVDPAHCLAFRLERAGIRAELVLYSTEEGLRILRCNNIKALADT